VFALLEMDHEGVTPCPALPTGKEKILSQKKGCATAVLTDVSF
jgi:hypothetical protein